MAEQAGKGISVFRLTGVLEIRRLVDQSTVAQPWKLTLRQISPGPFHGRLEYLRVNGILLYRERWSRRVVGTGETPPGYYIFGGPLLPKTRIFWCGTTLGPTRLAFGRPSSEVEFVMPEGSDHVFLLIPEKLLSEHLGEHLTPETSGGAGKYLTCDEALGQELVRMVPRLIDGFREYDALLSNDSMAKAFESQVLETIGQALEAANGVSDSPEPSKRSSALLRAVHYAADLRRPISVLELAKVSGVSQRVLELEFQNVFQVSPRCYLRWSRMNGAHRDLSAAQAGATLVKEVASRWGFRDFGRFAVEYKHLFGESPSITLARTAKSCPKRLADTLLESASPQIGAGSISAAQTTAKR